MSRSVFLCLMMLLGEAACYQHARRDDPAPPPKLANQPMVTIPTTEFTMGDRNGEPDEYPERQVQLDAYRIDQMEVSNAAYRMCIRAKACDAAPYLEDTVLGQPNHPVVGVTWEDAQRFCRWVNKRLPTEAEWELAARGPNLRKWPWRGAFDVEYANTVLQGDLHDQTAPVDAYPSGESPFGLLNVAGNAAEWTADFYDPTHYRTTDQTRNPEGPQSGRERVVRGGSYRESSHLARVSARRGKLPTESDNTIGFRCAADASPR